MRILILCTGNSCRSQMAHGFLQAMDSSLEVFSGGTQPAARVNARAQEMRKKLFSAPERAKAGIQTQYVVVQ